jgi:hypothetical protein
MKWLERDFEPNTRPQTPADYRLLILDRHNSHCTYPFIKFSAQHHIVIICLPSHTTHALQPCDVGVFGPLAHAWKSQVTQASKDNIPITKDNLLRYYHNARSAALKPSTIQSSFRRTGIYPSNRDAILLSAFEPAKNTTTQAAQPMPAQLPPSLVPTPNPSPAASAATMLTPNATPVTSVAPASLDLDVGVLSNTVTVPNNTNSGVPATESEQTQRYHIIVPPPLPHTASRKVLRQENIMLREIIRRVGVELEQDYAQMKLMDLENERLRQKAFAKDKRKAAKRKLTSGQARHMTAPEMLDSLARQTWESTMGDLFKEASERFKALRKAIDDHHKQIAAEKKAEEKARKAEERRAKKLEAEAEKARMRAERAATRGRGRGGRAQGHARGRGRGRGGQGSGVAAIATRDSQADSHDSEEQISESGSTTTDEENVPVLDTTTTQRPPRECRTRAPRFFADEEEEERLSLRPQPSPRPRPRPRLIPAQAAQQAQAVHEPGTQIPGSTIVSQTTQERHGDYTEGETMLTASTEQNREAQTHTSTTTQPNGPNPHQVRMEGPDAAQNGGNQSINVEVGPARVLLSGKQSIALVGSNYVPAAVTESSLLNRRSKRLAVREK